MARIYWRSSLFLYETNQGAEEEKSPILTFWRATVYTFAKPADEATLHDIIEDVSTRQARRTNDLPPEFGDRKAWEVEQVEPGESKGLGFYWVDVSRSSFQGRNLINAEERIEVVHLPTWKKTNARLGYSQYLGKISRLAALNRLWKAAGLPTELI